MMKESRKMAVAAILFFRMRKKIVRHTLVGLNILCKFGEFMFIIEILMKRLVKHYERMHRPTDRGLAFYNLLSRTYQPTGDLN